MRFIESLLIGVSLAAVVGYVVLFVIASIREALYRGE